MRYRYTPIAESFDTQGRITHRPIVEIEMIGKSTTLNAFALIDSGADNNVVNIEYARYLNIDLNNAQKKDFLGIGNIPMRCYLESVPIRVKFINKILSLPFAFIESDSVDILLGQEGFFDAFHIRFAKNHNTFDVISIRK